jgi:crossover junction endodeoxyribonuclease RuvC
MTAEPRPIVGIDPGAHGAIAVLDTDERLIGVWDMPTVTVNRKHRVAPQAIALLLAAHRLQHAFIERVGSMPGQGVASSFAFGYAAGVVEGLLAALSIPVSFVGPAVWKRTFWLGADKSHARGRAMQIFPAHANEFLRVRDDGRAEAVLIALHGLRSLRLERAA